MKKRVLQLAVLALVLFLWVQIAYRWMEDRVGTMLGLEPEAAAERTGKTRDPDSGQPLLTHEAAGRMILTRNIFKAAAEGMSGVGPVDTRLAGLMADNGPLELLGTVTGDDAAARAIIRSAAEERERIYRLGDVVEGAKIVRIERGRVALESAHGPVQLLLKARANEQVASSPVEAADPTGLSPLLAPQGRRDSGRIVPQALPGRRVNTVESAAPATDGGAAGVPVRTGAAALQPLDAPESGPQPQPGEGDAPAP